MFNIFPFTVALDRNLAVEFPSTEMYSLVLFNSRMNEKKKNDRRIIYNIFKRTLSEFDHIFLQDEDSKKYFKYFGVSENKLSICGPFKSAGTDLYVDKSIKKRMKNIASGGKRNQKGGSWHM